MLSYYFLPSTYGYIPPNSSSLKFILLNWKL
jgi:hypothetical protein